MIRALLPAVAAIVLAACPAVGATQTAPPTGWGEVAADAPAFMETYARDLRAGDREAIIARYDPAGVWLVSAGRGRRLGGDEVSGLYRSDQWSAPQAFEWQDLAFIASGPDAVVVTGRFVWTRANGVARTIAYHALLVRIDGDWRIRVEDETPVALGR